MLKVVDALGHSSQSPVINDLPDVVAWLRGGCWRWRLYRWMAHEQADERGDPCLMPSPLSISPGRGSRPGQHPNMMCPQLSRWPSPGCQA